MILCINHGPAPSLQAAQVLHVVLILRPVELYAVDAPELLRPYRPGHALLHEQPVQVVVGQLQPGWLASHAAHLTESNLFRIDKCSYSMRLDSEIQPSWCGSPVACGRVKHSVSYNSTSAPNPQALCWGYGRSASDSTLP